MYKDTVSKVSLNWGIMWKGERCSLSPCCLINDTLTITRKISSKYTRKYDVEYEYKCFIEI